MLSKFPAVVWMRSSPLTRTGVTVVAPKTIRVRRDQPLRSSFQTGRHIHAKMPLRGGQCNLLPRYRGETLGNWARAISERSGPGKAKVALARKLAVILHAKWSRSTPYREAMIAELPHIGTRWPVA